MDIPQELKEVIEQEITGIKNSDLVEESQKISEKYRTNNGKGQRLVTKESEVIAYAISRMPATYCAIYKAVSHTLNTYNQNIETVLDVGAGTGAATWAVSNIIQAKKYICLEREEQMRKIGNQLMQEYLKNVEWKKFDLVKVLIL